MKNSFDINKVRIESISIVKATIDNKSDIINTDETNIGYSLEFGFKFSADVDEKKLRVNFVCSIISDKSADGTENGVSGSFEVAYIFKVLNLEELVQGKDEEIKLENQLFTTVANIAYSTSRGIIYTRCLGTIMGNLVLPIVPTSIFTAQK
jgi:hypothetical protein